MYDVDAVREANRQNADRKIKVLGKTLTFREYLHPLALAPLREPMGDPEWLKLADKLIVEEFLEPGHEAEWKAIREEKGKPLSIYEIGEILEHIQAVTSGRPTSPSSASSTTPSRRGTSSTEKSPSEAAT